MTHETKAAVTRRKILTGAAAMFFLPATGARAESMMIRGTVVYRERMALPPTARLEVLLVDIARADGPARMIAKFRTEAGAGSPLAYTLLFNRSQISANGRYALQARISDGEHLLFTNTTNHPVLTGGKDETEILVQRVGSGDGPEDSPVGKWLAEDIGGGGVIDLLQSVLVIDAGGTVSGNGGCNGIAGRATIAGSALSFGHLASTNMACPPAVMDQERKFHEALSATRRFRIDAAERKLILLDETDKMLMRLSAM